jgi:hypothetical protein
MHFPQPTLSARICAFRCHDAPPGVVYKAIAHLDEVISLGSHSMGEHSELLSTIAFHAAKTLMHTFPDARTHAKRLLYAMRTLLPSKHFDDEITNATAKDYPLQKLLDAALRASAPPSMPNRLAHSLALHANTDMYLERIAAGERIFMTPKVFQPDACRANPPQRVASKGKGVHDLVQKSAGVQYIAPKPLPQFRSLYHMHKRPVLTAARWTYNM